jgi:hypothetical protein
MAKSKSPYLRLEKLIASDERGGVVHRWEYGGKLIEARAGRQQLPHGFLDDRVSEADRAGIKGISRREIQYRIQLASAYDSEAKVRTACAHFGSWSALRDAGFPSVEVDESDDVVDEIDNITATGSPTVEQDPLFDIPGFKPVLRINGRKRDLADVTVRDAIAYRDMCDDMHANFGRTVAQIKASVELMVAGAAGDLDANAVEAWRHATSSPTE